MYALLAERGTFQLLQLPGSAYAVCEGEYGKVFKDSNIAHQNWYAAYNFLLDIFEKNKKGTGHDGKGRGRKVRIFNERILHPQPSSGGSNPGNGKGPVPSHGAEQHQRHEVPQEALV